MGVCARHKYGVARLSWGVMMIGSLPRLLLKQPKFFAAAAGSLAVGLGLAAAFSSVADATLLRSLPVARPAEIVRIFTTSKLHPLGFVSYPDYEDFARSSLTSFESIAAQCQVLVAVGKVGETPRMRMGLAVTTSYFASLGVKPQLGRSFEPEDERAPVAILSDAYWRARWGGDPAAIGSTMEAAGTPLRIVGVAPRGFGLDRFLHEDFYVPAGAYRAGLLPSTGNPMDRRERRYFSLYARLRPGVAPAQAQAEATALAARLADAHPDTNRDHSVVVLTEPAARERLSPAIATLALLLLAAGALSVGIGCANASGLILLRTEARRGEFALRAALGARPVRILAEMLCESAWIATAGVAGALPVAISLVQLLAQSVAWPSDAGVAMDARFDTRMATTAAAAAVLCALVCGVAPWLLLHRAVHAPATRVTRRRGAQNALTALQIALAMASVAMGGGLLHALQAAARVDLGYRVDQ